MSWNYRVLRSIEGKKVQWFAYRIIEVYYDDDGKPNGWCETDVHAMYFSELRVTLNLMRRALKAPMLEMKRGKLVWADPDDAPPLNEADLERAHVFKNGKLVKKGKGKPPKDFK